jgi:hypothetical protein
MSSWSSPFAKWVVDGWKNHSKALGGPQVVVALRKSLADPSAAKARAKATSSAATEPAAQSRTVAQSAKSKGRAHQQSANVSLPRAS